MQKGGKVSTQRDRHFATPFAREDKDRVDQSAQRLRRRRQKDVWADPAFDVPQAGMGQPVWGFSSFSTKVVCISLIRGRARSVPMAKSA